MDVLVINHAGVDRREVDELPQLLKQEDAVIWVDIPVCDATAAEVLTDVFGFHRNSWGPHSSVVSRSGRGQARR